MSVIVTIVLLNVDWMWAMPVEMFFLTFFFCRALACGRVAGRRAAVVLRVLPSSLRLRELAGGARSMPLRGPLRVRALVCVRWPWTGRPLR